MRSAFVLALTTAGPVGAALAGDGEERIATTTEQALSGALVCVREVLAAARASLDQVSLVAVSTGPGSYTGLRIGVALAKSIAQARSLPIVGVSSYDVVDEGADVNRFPRVALVEGKRDFFYARIIDGEAGAPRHRSGSREELADVLATAEVRLLADVSAGEQALRVGRIGRRRAAAGDAGDWRAVEIDYGGRPNAVVNWERRQGIAERGGPASASNLKDR